MNSSLVPIIPGFFPDPTICRVGTDYYMAHSSFEYFPGAPIFHSTDLVRWTQIGHVLTRRSQFRLGRPAPSTGIYGSTLRYRDGRFWFITTNVSDFGSGQLIVHAETAAGPWSDPVFVPEAKGIDPDLCWDEAGHAFLTWKAMDFGVREIGIMQAPIDLSSGRLLHDPYPIWQGSGLGAAEAPHLYNIGRQWYLLLAEGGTERGHCVTVARGPAPSGPFEPHPRNPVFTHRSLMHPVQNVGHADLVRTPEGDWAAVYLGVRPQGSTPTFHVLGRETFLARVDWDEGWPVFDEAGFEVPPSTTDFIDDFSRGASDNRWIVPRGEPGTVAEPDPSGGVRVHDQPDGEQSLLCFRVRDLRWTAEARIAGDGGFLLRIDDEHWYGLTAENGIVRGEARIGQIQHTLDAVRVPGGPVALRIECVSPSSQPIPLGSAGPDEIVLSIVEGNTVRELGRLDGRYISTEVAAGFTGRTLAVQSAPSGAHLLSVAYTASKA